VHGLNIIRVIVSPRSSHAAGTDVVGHNIAVVGERFLAESAHTILQSNLPVEELPHFTVGSEFPVSPGMMQIFNASNAHLALALFSWYCFSAAAEERAVNRAQLITAESHGVLLIGLGEMVWLELAGNKIVCFSSRKPLLAYEKPFFSEARCRAQRRHCA
jgi:hypothetical protein